uniref:LYR motif containing 4 n=1 Tax=Capra hircus TaxID=9925 RepID=A0A8C2SJ71_CAPHI
MAQTHEKTFLVLALSLEVGRVQLISLLLWTEERRTYAIRRIRDAFRENKNVKDPAEIQALVNKARRDLGIIRRQVHIGQMYSTDKLVIENQEKPRA